MALQLSDNEKRDIIKFLEAGKPLPEKYRFLLFNDDREVELLWNGKTNEVTNVVLPFQTIEQIDEPRSNEKFGKQDSLFDFSGRQITGWTNKLIWGDNKLILSSLKNGSMRKEIEAQGGLKLIYIDPPFDVGADFSMDIAIGEESFTKKPSVIEEIAYRDTWGKGADSFIAMIYERLRLMHDLLKEDGSIYVHCDWRVSSYMRLILDEIFGSNNYRNEIIWKRTSAHSGDNNSFGKNTDHIFYYVKDKEKCIFNPTFIAYEEEQANQLFNKSDEHGRYASADLTGAGKSSGESGSEWRGFNPSETGRHWATPTWILEKTEGKEKVNSMTTHEKLELLYRSGYIEFSVKGVPRFKRYEKDMEGMVAQSLWTDVKNVSSQSNELLGYPTQKPEALIKRIIETSTNEGDLVADFFCGSGTTLATAEKLNRKWIGTDLGKFGIHTTRKRMIGIQRELKKDGKDFRAFEILNVGKYERESFLNVNNDLRAEEKEQQAKKKEQDFVNLIVTAYKAEFVESFVNIVAKKRDRLVAVGPINSPVSSAFIKDIVNECREKGLTKVDVLGFDYEMGVDFEEYKTQEIDIVFKVIPREVFDKRAIERGQVKFYDVAFIEAKPVIKGRGNMKEVSIELTDFSVFYSQEDLDHVIEEMKNGKGSKTKIVVDRGQVWKVEKNKDGDVGVPEQLTKKWSDWIDYWAVDFDFADRKEIIKVVENGEEKEVWTGDYIFDNEWQSFRTKKNRSLELVTTAKEMPKGNYKVAVKVVDIFGNDTTRVIDIVI